MVFGRGAAGASCGNSPLGPSPGSRNGPEVLQGRVAARFAGEERTHLCAGGERGLVSGRSRRSGGSHNRGGQRPHLLGLAGAARARRDRSLPHRSARASRTRRGPRIRSRRPRSGSFVFSSSTSRWNSSTIKALCSMSSPRKRTSSSSKRARAARTSTRRSIFGPAVERGVKNPRKGRMVTARRPETHANLGYRLLGRSPGPASPGHEPAARSAPAEKRLHFAGRACT